MSAFDDDDFFADIYDGSNDSKPEKESPEPSTEVAEPNIQKEQAPEPPTYNNQPLDEQPNPTMVAPRFQQNQTRSDLPDFSKRDGSATNTGQIYIPPKDEGKMFVGGLNWETTDESLRNYFSKFGELIDCTVMRDNMTGRSRGFGFLTFADPKCVNAVIATEHFLDGRIIDPKRAIPREEQDKTAKIFVGGVGLDVTEEDFNSFFSQYGTVIDAQLMIDTKTGKPRGFGFITFDSHEAVEKIVSEPILILKDKQIEVKKAEPRLRDQNGNFIPNSHAQSNSQPDGNNRFNNYNNNYMGYSMNGMNAASMSAMGAMGGAMGAAGGMNTANPGMNPAMAMQYFQSWQQYLSQAEHVLAAQGAQNNPAFLQQLQQVKTMKQNLLTQMKAYGFNPNTLATNANPQSEEGAQQNPAANTPPQNDQNFGNSNDATNKLGSSNGNSDDNAYNGDGYGNGNDNKTGPNRFTPRMPKSYQTGYPANNGDNKYYNGKGSAAITLLQGEDDTHADSSGSRSENDSHTLSSEQGHRDRDRGRDRDRETDKYGRSRYPRDSGREKRHRSKYEEDDDDEDDDYEEKSRGSSHRSSREKSSKPRDMSLGDRIREDSKDGGSRKRHRGEDDRDVSSSRHHRSSSRDKEHRSSRHKESGSGGKYHRSGRRKGSDDSNSSKKDSKEKESKDRRSKSPPLNAPTGPRGASGSSSFRSGKNYSKKYRSGRPYSRS